MPPARPAARAVRSGDLVAERVPRRGVPRRRPPLPGVAGGSSRQRVRARTPTPPSPRPGTATTATATQATRARRHRTLASRAPAPCAGSWRKAGPARLPTARRAQSGYAQPSYPPAAQPGQDTPDSATPRAARNGLPDAAVTETYRWRTPTPAMGLRPAAALRRRRGRRTPRGTARTATGRPTGTATAATTARVGRLPPPAYDPAQYNGSDYSMPGINGPGYDLSGIIGTGDFEAFGYDEPSYDRLAYDDPRYDDTPGYPLYERPRSRGETRFDGAVDAPLRRDPAGQPVAGRGRRTARCRPPATGTMGSGETAAAVRGSPAAFDRAGAALGPPRPGWT